jgi:ABC-type sugar transport system ATPase subunit
MHGIAKAFPGVQALKGVDLEVAAGEVLALVGENGAGKSTLIKTLGGAHRPDAGTIRIDGRTMLIRNPIDARRAGIAIIYQELNLVPALTARENIFLGRERSTAGFLHHRDEHRKASDLFHRIGVAIDPETPCSRLSVAQQQIVEIAKALAHDASLVVMDEPTAALTPEEVRTLLSIVRDLKRQGIGILYVSHRLEEVFQIADRVMVLRDGAHVGTRAATALTRQQLIEMMVGRKIEQEFPRREVVIGEPRLVVNNLSRGNAVRGVSFCVRRGEVVALTGLVGAGRTEVARLLFGADRLDSGTIALDGRELHLRDPRDAIRAGICLLTEDRKGQGLILARSVLENFGLPNLPWFSRLGFVQQRVERQAFDRYAAQLRIKVANPVQPVHNLSGGNQQKIVLAKWLQANSEVVIFDEPTRGIDVGAKYEIYVFMNQLATQGKAILMISSELPEVLGMADRILVMHEGRISGEIASARTATQAQIMDLAVK